MYKKDNIIYNKSFEFAVEIVNLYKSIVADKKEFVLSRQILNQELQLGQMLEKLITQKAKPILYIKWQLLKKKPMKLFIGWNCFTQLNLLTSLNLTH